MSTDYLLGEGGFVIVIRPLEEQMLHLQHAARLLRSYLIETDLETPQPERLATILYTVGGLLDALESQLEPLLDDLTRTLIDNAVYTTAGNANSYIRDRRMQTDVATQFQKVIDRAGVYAAKREKRTAQAT